MHAVSSISVNEVREFLIQSKLKVSIGHVIHFIPFDSIEYCEADSNYTYINTLDKRYCVAKTMKHLFANLPSHLFIRVHSKYCINISRVHQIVKGKNWLVMENGAIIRIARSRRNEIFKYFE